MEVPACPGCRERDARIAELEARLLAFEGRIRDLEDKVKSPPPPRPVTPTPPAPAKKPTGRKPGGQPGHPPRLKVLLPPDRVHAVVSYLPGRCDACGTTSPAAADPRDPPPTRHQVAELPPLAAEITEHQAHARTCPGCQAVTRAALPADVRARCIGPRLAAVFAYLAGSHGLSKRGIEEVSEAVFDVPIALGTVADLEQEVSAALATAHEQARAAIAAAEVKHVDETGWKQAGKKRWLWLAATAAVGYFVIHPRRNLAALKRLVGNGRGGILCSDRWCVYDRWPGVRQLCWAHLKRNWQKQEERGGVAGPVAAGWEDAQRRLFELWHLFRGGGCTRDELQNRVVPFYLELWQLLRRGRESGDRKLARFCQRLADRYDGLWAFVRHDGVDPTNHHAERELRRAVLWRRRSFGCHSADGCRFVERVLTAVHTPRLQKRSVLEFLTETIKAHRLGLPHPALITTG